MAEIEFEVISSRETILENAPIFHRQEFFKLHAQEQPEHFLFTLRRISDRKAVGQCPFFLQKDGAYYSPLKGSFGGLYLLPGFRSIQNFEFFWQSIESALGAVGAKSLSLTLPPAVYDLDHFSVQLNVLLRHGFSIVRHELNYARRVQGPFPDKLSHGNRKSIRKCNEAEFVVRQLEARELRAGYDVIVENRTRRNYPLSLSWEQLQETIEAFPQTVIGFGVWDGAALICSAICIRIDDTVLYVFYWGEVDGYTNKSPVALLAEYIYSYCMEQKLQILDIGTSTIQGEPNYGLIRFKENLGCEASTKLVLEKKIS